AADMSAELSLSLHLLATRRPESRLGKWHEQLGRQGGTVLHHITLLGEVLLRGGVEHAAQSATRTLQAETN
ncbi:hypothetical protein, partial [Kitasatospora aureofaciens]|uniref:hypothetical protein n=1 Tax=Kitasatospora aureofaciens TaxID=1894 RepID=UPI001F41F44C